MNKANAVIFILTLVFSILLVQTAGAQSQLKCLEQSKGKLLEWRHEWERDGQDEGILYEVKRVKIENRMPRRVVTLHLEAKQDFAKLAHRTAVIETEDKARSYCGRLHNTSARLEFQNSIQESGRDGFIAYSLDGWFREDMPRQGPFTECRVLSRSFLCLEKDKERYGADLKILEESLRLEAEEST